MTDVTLKPCPFCGGKADRFTIEEPGDNFGGDVISCTSCGASSHVEFGRKENLASRWNTRPASTEPADALAAELAKALVKLVSACRAGRMVPKPGVGACGMTIEAQTRASCFNGVDAWAVEEAQAVLDEAAIAAPNAPIKEKG